MKDIVKKITRYISNAKNEEELRIGFAKVIDPILEKEGIKPRYETGRLLARGRKDALYGKVIIEFKAPGKLKSSSYKNKSIKKLVEYIKEEARKEEEYGRYFGVLYDGEELIFVRYSRYRREWEVSDKLKLNEETLGTILKAIKGLYRKPLDEKYILEDFAKSEINKKVVKALYRELENPSPRSAMLFNEWKRIFSQVCNYDKSKLSLLVKYYEEEDAEKLMFCIHTYYTLLMKLLTAEVVTYTVGGSITTSYLKSLEDAYHRNKEQMKEELKDMEEGGIFADLGIRNFLEGDYFSWYIDEWNESLADAISLIVRKLREYEPATVELTPERVKDLFKRLYQYLVPKDVRRKLGEYFTPDWLAELVMNEAGYDGNLDKRVLDPSCGSGTFLVIAINRAKEWGRKEFVNNETVLRKILRNIKGMDLNPLAVLASRANYLIALGDLIRYRGKEGIEIPVYLADSIGTGTKAKKDKFSKKGGWYGYREIYLKTSVGDFRLPYEVVEKGLLSRILSKIKDCARNLYTAKDFERIIRKENISEGAKEGIVELYEMILKLEKEGKNRIWTNILKNAFAPFLIGKFDFVVGNPPWICWDNLPDDYKRETENLWQKYGIVGSGQGKFKRDIAMMFVLRCLDAYCKDKGKLVFLVPFTMFKSQAGAGFRRSIAKWKIERIHDMEALTPFEAQNKTGIIVVKKEGNTQFPIECLMWYREKKKIKQEEKLEDVRKSCGITKLEMRPIGKTEDPWMEITSKAINGMKKIIGSSTYEAHEGVLTALNQVYYVKILSEEPSGLLITNPPESRQKKNVKQVNKTIEKELVYPLVRGKDIRKWYTKTGEKYIIVPHNKDGKPISIDKMKEDYPMTYEYLKQYEEELIKRSLKAFIDLHKRLKKGEDTTELLKEKFHILDNVGGYIFSTYKVAWKYISGEKTGKAKFSTTVIQEGIPNDKVIFIPTDNKDEAYYLSGLLNSSPVVYTIIGHITQTEISTDAIKHIKIPRFNPNNQTHMEIAKLAEKAHKVAKKVYENNDEKAKEELKEIEEKIDKAIAKLYGITDDEMKEMIKCLNILKGEE